MASKIPTLSSDLIEELNKQFPLTNPHPGEDIRSIMYRAGQRSVVEHLLLRLERSGENILNTPITIGE